MTNCHFLIALIPWDFNTSKGARLENRASNLSMTQVSQTDEKALAGGKRNVAERALVLFIDKQRTFVKNHFTSQIETQCHCTSLYRVKNEAKEGKEIGQI